MKMLPFYKTELNCTTKKQVFDFLISELKPSNMTWSYFVNWEKVFTNTKKIELALNTLNYLIGKPDFDKEFKSLLKEHPKLAEVIPALAVRKGGNTQKFEILASYSKKKFIYKDFNFTKSPDKITDKDINKYLEFVKETGLKDLFVDKKVKNLVDYIIGVEAGLESNARKNRSGKTMEVITEIFVKDVCKKNNFQYESQVTSKRFKEMTGDEVPIKRRTYDFVINNKKGLFFIIEVNFYNSEGSKSGSIAESYRERFDELKKASDKYQFIWITDGIGWTGPKAALKETFDHNDYVFSLAMLQKGILEHLLAKQD